MILNLARNSSVDAQAGAFSYVLTGLARLANSCETLDDSLRDHLQSIAANSTRERRDLSSAFTDYLRRPVHADEPLVEVTARFSLDPIEALAVRLAIAAEQDIATGHLLWHLQQPLAHSRPTIGLIAQAYAPENVERAVHVIGQGNAVRCGLVQLCGEDNPLPERQIRIPLCTVLALQHVESAWPGTASLTSDVCALPLGKTSDGRALAFAKQLRIVDRESPVLVIRCGDSLEARAAAAQVCAAMPARAVMIQADQVAGMAPWLVLNRFIPVHVQWLLPGERGAVLSIPGYTGPIILLTGPEGEFECDDRPLLQWCMETPSLDERAEIWTSAIGDHSLAARLAAEHRHSAGRIAALASKARSACAVSASSAADVPLTYAHIRSVARRGDSVGLGALAELIADEVDDDALVVTHTLRQELESLVTRCRLREQFPQFLGPSIQARYRPSVRALFVGPSGTGKTLAVSWLATRLGIPLFRVDLSAITSKYIGETEKNLSQLLARAERNEVLLLFDEADSLFGKRTDIHEANDRFANAQTNYLLQRMESYDGITILTSNGRSRFDDAFSRRFDAILSFPLPGPEERRALWIAHMGAAHSIPCGQLNLLAATAELTGGQIRNAVLRAAVDAAQDGTAIQYRHLLTGIASEYRKLSRQLPSELKQAQAAEHMPSQG
jgi:hypothetical protein